MRILYGDSIDILHIFYILWEENTIQIIGSIDNCELPSCQHVI